MEININFSGGTFEIFNYPQIQLDYILTGTGTLTSNFVITAPFTPKVGQTVIFYYKGNVTKGSYNFTVLGTNLSADQLSRESTITAVFNGLSWQLNIAINTQTANWLKPTDQTVGGNYDVITAPVSFESGEQGDAKIYLPYPCIIKAAIVTVTKALAGTDDANVTMDDNGGATIFSLTIVKSSSLGFSVQNTNVNYNYTPSPGISSYITLRQSKTTPGGKGTVAIITQRI